MAKNAVEKRERFLLLLQQLRLTNAPYIDQLQNGQIEKLIVDRKNKKWHFYFSIENILPASMYRTFRERLTQTFQHIAQVDFSLRVNHPSYEEELVAQYWTDALQTIDGISPMLLSLLNGQQPKVVGNQLVVAVRNDTEAQALQLKYGQMIIEQYLYLWLLEFVIRYRNN